MDDSFGIDRSSPNSFTTQFSYPVSFTFVVVADAIISCLAMLFIKNQSQSHRKSSGMLGRV
jgi:hypothetical protein